MRSYIKGLLLLGISAALLVPKLSPQRGPALQAHGTGLIPLDAREIGQIIAKWPRVNKVHLNRVGYQRVNDVRVRKGQSRLPAEAVKPVGHEVESSIYSTNLRTLAAPAQESYAADRPVFVDNSTLKYFPPIRNQGLIGSCTAFATTYMQLSYMTAFERDLDIRSGADNTNKYSPKWTYDMINGGSDNGSSFSSSYNLLERHGACTWAEFPYDSDYRAWLLNASAWRNALSVRTKAVQYVFNVSTDDGLALTKDLLTNGYVVVFGTYMYSWQYKSIQDDTSTPNDDGQVGKSVCYWLNGTSGGHAMTIVGYNDAIWTDINANGAIDTGEKGAFRIANSWGAGWGDAGLTWLAYDALRSTSLVPGGPSSGRVAALQGDMAFILTARDNYSPSMIAEFTVNHAKRSQLGMFLGLSNTTTTTPTSTWAPAALNYQGGYYAFDGTTTPVSGTFVLDLTDLLNVTGTTRRYYLGMADSTAGDTATLSAFRILDLSTNPATEVVSSLVPQTVDAATVYAYVDHSYTGPRNNHDPSLSGGQVNPSSGNASTEYEFRVRYQDPDGDAPAVVSAYIDGIAHAMSLSSGAPANGYYSYVTLLPSAAHSFWFTASDGRGGTARDPIVSGYTGPLTRPVKSDFNADDREDILWRYSGSGGYNLIWFLGETGSAAQPLRMADAATMTAWPDMSWKGALASAGMLPEGQEKRAHVREKAPAPPDIAGLMSDHAPKTNPMTDPRQAMKRGARTLRPVPAMADPRRVPLSPRTEPLAGSDIKLAATTPLGLTALPSVADLTWQVVGTGDFNNDGHTDILWRYNGPGGYLLVWYMNGTEVTGLADLPTVADLTWQVVGTGDFNNDGHIDILWRNAAYGYALIWFMDGISPTSLAALPTVSDLNWEIVGTGDFNNDTHVDILWRYAGAGGYNLVWYLNGTDVTSLGALPTVSDANWKIVGTGDYNDDTHVDILWRYAGAGGYNLIWFMDGASPKALGDLPAVPDLNWKVVSR
jgi:C1A family cysteine protease